jgi:multiple sugar transport system permease protein
VSGPAPTLPAGDFARAAKARARRVTAAWKGLAYVVLAAGGLTFMLPLAWMISTSLKAKGSVFAYPPEWIPRRQLTAWGPDVKQANGHWVPLGTGGEKRLSWATDEDGTRLKVVELRNIEDAKVVQIVEPVDRKGEIIQLPLYRATGAGRMRPVFEPISEVHVRWGNYPQAWSALELREPWLAFRLPYALRFGFAGRTYQIGPVGFRGFHIRSAFTAFYLNSVLVAVCVTLGQVLTSSLAAYAFARLHFPGRDKLFLGYLGTLMVPYVVTMIPVFILLRLMHLVDTYAALILPAMFSAYGTFMLRQFFLTIPTELEDAARIDGCGKWGIYTNVILPLSKPALATLTTFVFLSNWNSFMWPLIVISSPEKKTLPIGLYAFMGQYDTEWTLLMAASLMVMLPVLVVFLAGQRYFVKGIVLSGLKG